MQCIFPNKYLWNSDSECFAVRATTTPTAETAELPSLASAGKTCHIFELETFLHLLYSDVFHTFSYWLHFPICYILILAIFLNWLNFSFYTFSYLLHSLSSSKRRIWTHFITIHLLRPVKSWDEPTLVSMSRRRLERHIIMLGHHCIGRPKLESSLASEWLRLPCNAEG